MGIYAVFEREDGSTYEVDLDPDWKLHLTDGQIILAEDLETGDEIESHYSNETGGRGHVALSVMGE